MALQIRCISGTMLAATLKDGSTVTWNAGIYKRMRDISERIKIMFNETNDFFNWLPDNLKMEVDDFYRETAMINDRGRDQYVMTLAEYSVVVKEMTQALRRRIALFSKHVTLDTIREWRVQYGKLNIPDLGTEYSEFYKEDATYITTDYEKLLDLCVFFRLMVPVWCEYYSAIAASASSNMLELRCFDLLSDARGIMESSAMEKLERYVRTSGAIDLAKSATAILNGIPKDDIPRWVLGITVVNRLAIGELSSADNHKNLVTSVFGYMRGVVKRGIERRNMGMVQEIGERKKKSSAEREGEGPSDAEYYTAAQDISYGDLDLFEVAIVKHTNAMALRLLQGDPCVDDPVAMADYFNKIRICKDYLFSLNDLSLTPMQTTLLGWITNDIVYYQLFDRLGSEAYHTLIAIAQGYCWFNGIPDVAVLLTAKSNDNLEYDPLGIPSSRLSTNMLDRVTSIYDMYYTTKQTEEADSRVNKEELDKKNNVAVVALRSVIKHHNDSILSLRAPDSLWHECTSRQESGYIVFRDISHHLITLIEIINNKGETK